MAAAIAARRPELLRGVVLEEPTWHPVHRELDAARGAAFIEDTEDARRDPAAALERVRAEVPHWSPAGQEAEVWGQAHVDPRFLALGPVTDVRYYDAWNGVPQPYVEVTSIFSRMVDGG